MVFQMILMTLVISSCFAFLQAGLEYAPPLFFGAIRTFSAGTFLLFVLVLLKKPVTFPKSLLKWLIPLSVFSTTLTFGAMFESSQYTTTGIGTLLANAQPLILGGLGLVLFKETVTKRRIIILLLGVAGVMIISIGQLTSIQGSLLGIYFALGTSFSSTIGSLIAKKANPATHLLPLTAWQLILGSLPLLIASIIFESDSITLWTFNFIGILLYLSLFGTAFTVVIWFQLLQKHNTSQLAPYLFLTPIFGLIFAVFILKEPLTLLEGFGILIVLGGLTLDILTPKTKEI